MKIAKIFDWFTQLLSLWVAFSIALTSAPRCFVRYLVCYNSLYPSRVLVTISAQPHKDRFIANVMDLVVQVYLHFASES